LKAILFAGFAGDQFKPVACILPQHPNRLVGNEAARNQAQTKQVADPFRILDIVLVALYSPDPLGIGDGDVDGILQ